MKVTIAERTTRFCVLMVCAALTVACSGGDDEAAQSTGPPPTGNSAPTIAGTPPLTAQVGTPYSFTPTASDANGDVLTFGILNPPAWATFSTTTGQLQGTPTAAGTFANVTIGVSDGMATVGLPPFTITVTGGPPPPPPSNSPPTISGTPPTSGQVGTLYTFTPTASDPENDPLTFVIANRPAWATFTASTGRLQGTPTAAGTFANVAIGVSDGTTTVGLAPFTITVTTAPPPPNSPPTISGTPPTSGQVGTQYSFTPTASDPNNDPLTFLIANRPAWATFTASTGRLQGTPTAAGTFANITISVNDGTATTSLPAFTITVAPAPNSPPTISGTPPTSVLQDSLYSFTPTASDANGDTLTFAITNPPVWATFSTATGQLQGTPTAGDVGSYANVTISVSDGSATAALPAFTITVVAVGTGTATLTWTPPTQNEDGSPLTDLASYRIHWGTASRNYTNSATISSGLTTYVVTNLLSGTTYYFATTAGNSQGVYSAYSNEATKTIP
ncbi:MAG TPA: putative Ig domain-containing protein [Gammaproteobacteria bacterium]